MALRFMFFLLPILAVNVQGQPLLGPEEQAGLESALAELDMTLHDLSFHKDVAEPELVYQWSKDWLHDPLQFPKAAEDLSAELKDGPLSFDRLSALMEVEKKRITSSEIPSASPFLWSGWDDQKFPDLAKAIREFLGEVQEVVSILTMAFESIPAEEREYLACSLFSGQLNAEDRPEIVQEMMDLPLPQGLLDECLREGDVLDPAPFVDRFVRGAGGINRHHLLLAAEQWMAGLRRLETAVASIKEWPWGVRLIETPWGDVLVGTESDDQYAERALLILDPAGEDEYRHAPGVANGLAAHPLAAIIDLAGRDRYRSDALLGPGTALFGLAAVLDHDGNDHYDMSYMGAGAGLYGFAWVEDRNGDDIYRAETYSQGAGVMGVGVLDDAAGSDVYTVGYSGQGYSGVLGVGLLVDRLGNDHYIAGSVRPDYERHDDRYLSMSQGFSIGGRPHAGGGFAALVDQSGNDSYVGDIYGQGCGYWYAAGLLIDEAGNDNYQLHQYGQGSGIHLSLGLLADRSGRDKYTGYVLTQGSAHDYGVGFFFEGAGEDTYVADHHSQGRALNNALAVLIDSAGNDAYFSRQCDRSQGIGNDGDTREYGSLALLIDLAGEDQYNCGGQNGKSHPRPNFGVIYDRAEGGE